MPSPLPPTRSSPERPHGLTSFPRMPQGGGGEARLALADELAALVSGGAAGALRLVGRTPCIRLDRLGPGPRAEILAKLEMRNPGGSLKDRTALGLIADARSRGVLREGAAIVEPTAGNTGIGLALVGRALGHDVTLVMPERYGVEKARVCEALGARVIRLAGDAVAMRECLDAARRLEACGAVLLNQFENGANPLVHELTTGPELREACGDVDAVVIGVGTGGTFTGVVRALRERDPGVVAVAVESQGSVLGGRRPVPTRIHGIGNAFVPPTLDTALIDEIITVADDDAFATARRLASDEGLLTGPSGGAILHAALVVARRLGPGRRVATIIPDGADRYWSNGPFS